MPLLNDIVTQVNSILDFFQLNPNDSLSIKFFLGVSVVVFYFLHRFPLKGLFEFFDYLKEKNINNIKKIYDFGEDVFTKEELKVIQRKCNYLALKSVTGFIKPYQQKLYIFICDSDESNIEDFKINILVGKTAYVNGFVVINFNLLRFISSVILTLSVFLFVLSFSLIFISFPAYYILQDISSNDFMLINIIAFTVSFLGRVLAKRHITLEQLTKFKELLSRYNIANI